MIKSPNNGLPGNRFLRLALAGIAILALAGALAAEDPETRITAITGKVELQNPGGDWGPATVGQVVTQGSIISTGFKSEAIVQIGSAKVTMKALTRLSVKELAEQAGLIKADVYLQVGRVKADVQKVPEKALNYKFRSPVATASVRGTELEFDGVTLTVSEGLVNYVAPDGNTVSVGAGEEVSFNTNAPAGSPGIITHEEILSNDSTVVADPGADFTPDPTPEVPVPTPVSTGTVIIIVE